MLLYHDTDQDGALNQTEIIAAISLPPVQQRLRTLNLLHIDESTIAEILAPFDRDDNQLLSCHEYREVFAPKF